MCRKPFNIAVLLLVLAACDSGQQASTGDARVLEPIASVPTEAVAISIVGDNGKFVCADQARVGEMGNALICDRSLRSDWETFNLVPLDSGRVALQASNGKFVCADRTKGGLLTADRDHPGEWETFELVPMSEGRFAMRTLEGLYVGADYALAGGDNGLMRANRQQPHAWETFLLLHEVGGQQGVAP
jgi:hypothetical protein